jgi:hypothetical protein
LPANVRWLAGYRHPRHHLPDVAAALLAAFADPASLLDGRRCLLPFELRRCQHV